MVQVTHERIAMVTPPMTAPFAGMKGGKRKFFDAFIVIIVIAGFFETGLCMDISEIWQFKVPLNTTHIIQVGDPRTATTLQFQTLCALSFLKFKNKSLDCNFNKWISTRDVLVTKTHNWTTARKYINKTNTIFFATTKKGSFNHSEFDFEYIVNTKLLKKRGEYLLYEYARIFQLNDAEAEMAFQFLKYWDILRICCGTQMSISWRLQLKKDSGEVHLCDLYNISKVEFAFMKTQLYHEMKENKLEQMLKPSTADGELNGEYCEMYNDGVKRCGWRFNSWKKGIHQCPDNI